MLEKQWHSIVSCHSFLDEYDLVAENKECDGSEIKSGNFASVSECASSCKSASSMFIFRIDTCSLCDCYCETNATNDGTCHMKDIFGYSLYKFDNSGK